MIDFLSFFNQKVLFLPILFMACFNEIVHFGIPLSSLKFPTNNDLCPFASKIVISTKLVEFLVTVVRLRHRLSAMV